MDNKDGTRKIFNLVKQIVENYMNNRKPAAIVLGTYTGTAMLVNERLLVPMSLVTGNMKGKLAAGDKVSLLRNDGGNEYFILEIIGRPYQTTGG